MGQTMSNMGNIGEANWQDLDTSEKFARLGMGGAKGFGQGLQNYQQQNAMMRQGGGGAPIPQTPAAPPVQIQPQNFTPGSFGPGSTAPSRSARNPFFYGYGDDQGHM